MIPPTSLKKRNVMSKDYKIFIGRRKIHTEERAPPTSNTRQFLLRMLPPIKGIRMLLVHKSEVWQTRSFEYEIMLGNTECFQSRT